MLIEKPMATRVEDCDRMLAAAAQRGLKTGVAHNLRFRVNLPKVRELVQSGAIGRIQSMQFSMFRQLANAGNFGGNKMGWVNQPETIGFVIDGLPHGLDAMRWVTGAEVVRVAGLSRTYTPEHPIEDTTVGIAVRSPTEPLPPCTRRLPPTETFMAKWPGSASSAARQVSTWTASGTCT